MSLQYRVHISNQYPRRNLFPAALSNEWYITRPVDHTKVQHYGPDRGVLSLGVTAEPTVEVIGDMLYL